MLPFWELAGASNMPQFRRSLLAAWLLPARSGTSPSHQRSPTTAAIPLGKHTYGNPFHLSAPASTATLRPCASPAHPSPLHGATSVHVAQGGVFFFPSVTLHIPLTPRFQPSRIGPVPSLRCAQTVAVCPRRSAPTQSAAAQRPTLLITLPTKPHTLRSRDFAPCSARAAGLIRSAASATASFRAKPTDTTAERPDLLFLYSTDGP
jgi:hypothetical protein